MSEMKVDSLQAFRITTRLLLSSRRLLPKLATLAKSKLVWTLLLLSSSRTENMILTSRTPRMTDPKGWQLPNCLIYTSNSWTATRLFQLKTHSTRMTGRDMPLSPRRLESKFKLLVMICSSLTPWKCSKLSTRRPAMLFYWRWTKSDHWQSLSKPQVFRKAMDSEWWSVTDLEKPKIASLLILLSVLALAKSRLELLADLKEMQNTTNFSESNKN